MSNIFQKETVKLHLIFLLILSSYYLIPYILVGQLIAFPHDNFDNEIVYNNIIGRLFRGETDAITLFLSGEVQWYFLRRVLQPLTFLLYGFFKTEVAYWSTDILVKLISYICFFKLSRKLHCSYFDSALIASIIASCIIFPATNGLGTGTLIYAIYLIIKNKNLKLKHYFLLALFGLNIDLSYDIFVIPLAFFLSLILFTKKQAYNFKLFIKITAVLLSFILLSNSNLIYALIVSEPFHRSVWISETPNLLNNFYDLIRNFFAITAIKGNAYFFHNIPLTLCFFPIICVALFSKNRTSYLLLLLVFIILFIDFFLNLEFVNSIRNNSEGLIKTLNWGNIKWKLPVVYGLIFISITKSDNIRKNKYFIYPLIFLSLFAFQIRVSVVPLTKHFLSFNNLNVEQQNQLTRSFHERNYDLLIKDFFKFNEKKIKYSNKVFKSKYTFKGYYEYENYEYIKSLVGNSRTISVALDPMVAVMNNIGVIDGYHTLYPLSYKLKFRKIINKQLDHYEDIKKYYDNWGHRVYTFVSDPKVIKINFVHAKNLGAEYVISKYLLSDKNLLPICEYCNKSNNFFLYKIETELVN